ncbi:uncharacterized protein A4U43_C03F30200 [Asparagus officinalis]|uniref:Btz domain-containing protein n=1 Tax=Asparagus officinalis TaxID=4686 RepID=A0A5P1FGU1_ASPOF|nr:uncharacterized protein A4U43_C03F30200 [Asparagus officinalis]
MASQRCGGRRATTAGESDGEGGAPAYENEEEQDEEYDEEYEEEIEEEDEIVVEEEEEKDLEGGDEKDLEGSRRKDDDEEGEKRDGEGEGSKKENEPFAVPTAGAFYMHDDRFQENGRGRQRRMPGGRRLWESKDDRAWVHDRFEEMKLNDDRYDQGRRNSRGGRFRGRGGGRPRVAGRAYVKGNSRPRGYYDDVNNQNRDGNSQIRDGNNQNRPQKSVRGRGPRRYEPIFRNNEVSASHNKQNKQPAKTRDSTLNIGTGKPSSQTPNVQSDPAIPRKNAFASSLNSASPPFYPSGSSKQDLSVTQKRDAHVGNTNKIVASSLHMGNNFLSSQSGSTFRAKATEDSFSHDRKYIDDSLRSVAGKALANAQVQSSGSPLTSANMTQTSQSRAQGRNSNTTGQPNYQPTNLVSQVPRAPQQLQAPLGQQRPQTQYQPALRVSTQQVVQRRPSSGNQVSSPPHAPTTNASGLGETDSPLDSNNSKTQLIARGKTGSQGAGRGSFLYNGAQIIGASGAMGLSQNDQNFPGTLLPVMQFGGQHHGGIPALGMAFPGYVAQPQQGLGSSEMTWVPVLAGAAGALGASYPYIALDGSYYPQPSGQASSAAGSRETSAPKPADTLKPPERLEIVNDEFGQRQNKPRRYSEMNFGQ